VPNLSVPRGTTRGFLQTRFGEIELAPAGGTRTTALGPKRIRGCHACGLIIGGERLVITVGELTSVAELDPGLRTVCWQKFSQPFGLDLGQVEAADAGIQADE
jgi:hypothetical protein